MLLALLNYEIKCVVQHTITDERHKEEFDIWTTIPIDVYEAHKSDCWDYFTSNKDLEELKGPFRGGALRLISDSEASRC
jgi:hypothetical protein